MKLHHIRLEYQREHPQGMGLLTYTFYWCGKSTVGIIEKNELVPEDAPPPAPGDHCKRCLASKRAEKGDAYMIEHGFPLMRFTGTIGGTGGRGPILEDPYP